MTQIIWVFNGLKTEWSKQTGRFYAIAVMSASRKFSIKAEGY